MKHLKVGTVTVALLLISIGAGMLTFPFFPDDSFSAFIYVWWPVLLIILGIETLVHIVFSRKTDSPKIRYDAVSIFIIFLFGFTSAALGSVHESGILPAFREAVSAKQFEIQSGPYTVAADGLDTVHVSGYQIAIEKRETASNQITIYYQWRKITALSEEEAEQLTSGLMTTYRDGSTLYVNVRQPMRRSKIFHAQPVGNIIVHIPESLKLEY